jgi:hypothetical protein
LNQRHVFGCENADFTKNFAHAVLYESIGMEIDGSHDFQILFDLFQNFMFVEDDSPALHPAGD